MARRPTPRKEIPVALLALLVLSVFPMPVASLEVSAEMEIEDTDTYDYSLRVDADATGNYHVVYLAAPTGTGDDDVMYRKVGPTGSTLKGPIELTPSDQDSPPGQLAVAVDSSGRAHVAFVTSTGSTSSIQVFYAQVGTDGSVAVSPKSVHEQDTSPSGLDIEADSSGNAYIVWQDSTDPPRIVWAKVSSTGSVVVQPQEISGTLGFGGSVYYPRIGMGSQSDSLVVWEQITNRADQTSIWFARVDSQGNIDVDPVEVASSTLYDLVGLEATADTGEDELHMVYVQNNGAMYLHLDGGGTAIREITIYKDLVAEASTPDLAVAPDGDLYITYWMRANPVNAPWNIFVAMQPRGNDTFTVEQVNQGQPVSYGRPAAHDDGGAVFFNRDGDLQMVTVTEDVANRPPVPSLSYTPSQPGVGDTVTLDGSGSTDPDDGDTVEEYHFEFGDGGSSGWTTSDSVTHTYSSAGQYTARLRVKDSQGMESTGHDTVTITVSSTPTNKVPTARLTADPTTADTGQEVTFDGTSSTDQDGTVSLYRFDFGDGEETGWVSSGVQKHPYDDEGVYTATLWVKDDDGAESLPDTARVEVEHTNEAPTATIVSITPNPAMQGEEIAFVGKGEDSDGTVLKFTWESDLAGIIGTAESLDRTLAPGMHTITFKVQDDEGDWSDVDTAMLEVRSNTRFEMEDRTQMPDQVYTDTLVEFRVVYTDVDNDRPTVTNLLWSTGGDWKTDQLVEVDASDKNYVDGKEYFFNKKFEEPGDYKYSFEFANNQHPKRKTTAVELQVQEAPGLFPAWEVMPAAGAMVLAAMAMVVVHGRRRHGPGGTGHHHEHSKTVR